MGGIERFSDEAIERTARSPRQRRTGRRRSRPGEHLVEEGPGPFPSLRAASRAAARSSADPEPRVSTSQRPTSSAGQRLSEQEPSCANEVAEEMEVNRDLFGQVQGRRDSRLPGPGELKPLSARDVELMERLAAIH